MKLTRKATTEQIAQLLQSKNRIALFAHTNPDGDAIGATISLSLGLQQLGKQVTIFCDTPMNNKLDCFAETKQIKSAFEGKYDLMVAVDCGDLLRLGEFSAIFDDFAETATIDHHGGEYYAGHNCVLPTASCCQIVYDVLKHLPITFDKTLATYLYMGLCTDTGNFAHNNTDSDAFAVASELANYGADMEKVYRVFFRDTTLAETKLTGKVLGRLRTYYGEKMVLLYVTKAELDEYGLDGSATSGLVQYAINVDTAKVGVCICEHTTDVYKVSMRGKDFNVREVCQQFGGGGHILAAGCMINGMMEEVIEKIVRVVGFTI